LKFIEIARAEKPNVSVKVPEDTVFSFFDSPYIGHRSSTAIDIYFKNREALLPVDEAVVKEIRWLNAPKYRVDGSEKEPLIVFKIRNGIVLKMLHVKPEVRIGEKLVLGDYIGKCIVSGYLCPWSGIHAHIEVRPENDPYRARGAFKLYIAPTVSRILEYLNKTCVNQENLVFTVMEVKDAFMWVKFKSIPPNTPYSMCLMNKLGEKCVLDAGIPYYGIGGCLGRTFEVGEQLYANKGKDYIVGLVISSLENASLFTSISEVYVDGVKVRGIGTYIGTSLAKIVFLDKKVWKEGDEGILKFKQVA